MNTDISALLDRVLTTAKYCVKENNSIKYSVNKLNWTPNDLVIISDELAKNDFEVTLLSDTRLEHHMKISRVVH